MNIMFHNIDSFGYFKRAIDKNKQVSFNHIHGSIEGIMTSLKKWLTDNDLAIEDTTTIGDAECNYTGAKNVYCHSLSKFSSSDDFLLITWNETENSNSSVSFLKKDAKVGSGEVQGATLGSNFIPGYPSYFWFIPDKNMFATLKLQNMSTGTWSMKRYLKNFMKFINQDYITREVKMVADQEVSTLIYGGDKKLKPQITFNDSVIIKDSDLEFLKKNSDQFQFIRCSTELSRINTIEKDLMDRLIDMIGLGSGNQKQKCRFKFEVEYDLGVLDVETLYKKFGGITNDNLGLVLDDKVYWLKDMQARCKVNSTNLMKDRNIADQDKLIQFLEKNKNDLFSQANIR